MELLQVPFLKLVGGPAPGPNPALVYVESLSPGSRRTMRQSLNVIAGMVAGADLETLYWAGMRYQQTTAVRNALAERYAASTANKMLCALRGTLKRAHRLGQMTGEEYQRAIDLDTVMGEAMGPSGRAVGRAEMQGLGAVCAADSVWGRRDWAILCVGWGCGLRRAEMAGLTLSAYDGESFNVKGKRNKRRRVPAPDFVRGSLAAWLGQRGSQPGALFTPVLANGVVDVRGLTPQAYYAILRKRQAEAEVARFSPHDLRRSYVSNLLAADVDIATVASLAGHSNIQTTARYDRRPDERKRAAVGHLTL